MPYYFGKTIKYLKTIRDRIQASIYELISELKVTVWVTPEPVAFDRRTSGAKKILTPGKKWGKLWDCGWFHFTGRVPPSAAGEKIVILIDICGEACIVDESGCPVRGLTTLSSTYSYSLGRPGKRVVQFLPEARGDEAVDLWAEGGCNDLFGELRDKGTLKEANIAICHEEIRRLYYDFFVLFDLMEYLPEDRARHQRILAALNRAANLLSDYTEEEARRARDILAAELKKRTGDPSLTISAIGHAHIDLAWLWPLRETVRKGARSFSTVLDLMERYPDYTFGASQPQLYEWIKERHPLLYRKIKSRIEEGRWEPQGAMWVEADTNISGGEALIRQILFGKRFFRSEFGKDMKILWLPDVFGYSASLPQLLKKSGIAYFMTIKLSWNNFNIHPHHTFIWRGIDGSEVLVHMPPEGNYNSSAAPRAIIQAEKAFQDKAVSDRCLILFGIGDGGGGPGAEHLEYLEREKNLAGLSPVIQEPAEKFFKRIEKDRSKYKTWSGELYLERHQGTYTTQARNKWYNRKLEITLRELEIACVLSDLASGFAASSGFAGSEYPKGELNKIWKEVLLYQFHDILPGSSISRVYEESLASYQQLLKRTKELTGQAYDRLGNHINTSGFTEPVIVINSLSWERKEWIKIGEKWFKGIIPPLGYSTVEASSKQDISVELSANEKSLENDLLRIDFAEDGSIQSIFDKEYRREILNSGRPANRLAVYEDNGDAWDIPINYEEKPPSGFTLISKKAGIDGPLAIMRQEYRFADSRLIQEITVRAGSRRIDFATEVDWKESGKMLRTSFPLAILATTATCDIQFGSIQRPTHRNTSWDMAKYEICAHKWVDISQVDYGVALLNDSKYGYKAIDNILDLNLLRSPGHPDPAADRAHHQFVYSLFPHQGNHISGGVVRAGYELNVPLSIIPARIQKGSCPPDFSFLKNEAENIVVETIKKAEEGEDIIVRLYETHGAFTQTSLLFNFRIKSVYLVTMTEEDVKRLKPVKGAVKLDFKPFEIHTLKISKGPPLVNS